MIEPSRFMGVFDRAVRDTIKATAFMPDDVRAGLFLKGLHPKPFVGISNDPFLPVLKFYAPFDWHESALKQALDSVGIGHQTKYSDTLKSNVVYVLLDSGPQGNIAKLKRVGVHVEDEPGAENLAQEKITKDNEDSAIKHAEARKYLHRVSAKPGGDKNAPFIDLGITDLNEAKKHLPILGISLSGVDIDTHFIRIHGKEDRDIVNEVKRSMQNNHPAPTPTHRALKAHLQ